MDSCLSEIKTVLLLFPSSNILKTNHNERAFDYEASNFCSYRHIFMYNLNIYTTYQLH